MEAEDRNADTPECAQDVPVILDLLVAPRQAEHGLVVEMRGHVLDRLEHEPMRARALDEVAQVLLLPARFARQFRRVQLDPADADLRGEAQLLLRELVELPDGDPDTLAHAASPHPFTEPAVSPCTMKRWAKK